MFNFNQFDHKATKIFDHAQGEIAALRSGGASISMIDNVTAQAYDTQMKINELASITIPDPTLIVISPWDKSLLSAIAKGVQQAGLNLNPVIDGDIIRISVPALTQEARGEQVKILHQRVENIKVIIRNLRADTKKEIEAQEGESGISDDDIAYDLEALEDKTRELTKKLDEMSQAKEKQLLSM